VAADHVLHRLRAAVIAPSVPLAPGLLRMITDWPSRSFSRCAIGRAT
jgi:hypothetical protein